MKIVGGLLSIAAIVSLFSGSSSAASGHEIIIRLKPEAKIEQLEKEFMMPMKHELLVQDLNLYKVNISANLTSQHLIRLLNDNKFIKYAQKNDRLQRRSAAPNDQYYSRQWHLGGTSVGASQAPLAWKVSTGGKDIDNNEIVVAVVDGGFYQEHPDLKENLWSNKHEIPDNKKDDDGNGYVDDFKGWNADNNTDKLAVDSHGTMVAGIIAAKSNNSVGVAGVNWNAKVMPVSINVYETANVLKAYGYILKQKKVWINSQRKKGANVVAVNSSWGLDGADCTSGDFPAWNDIIDEMGAVGILSAMAVPNNSVDIDKVGDVPSGCSSDYIISVTNSNEKGVLSQMSAYGRKGVDLSAPGENIFSLTYDKDWFSSKVLYYTSDSGTSFATPMVAGGVALMMSAASSALISDYYKDPSTTILLVKEMMLNSVDKTNQFSSLVSSGGRLNLNESVLAAQRY